MATSTAETTTLSTPKLLELILLTPDIQAFPLHQRACQTWRETIQGSPAVQKHLFLAPIDDSPTIQNTHVSLLVRIFPLFFVSPYEHTKEPLLAELDMLKTPENLKAYIRPEDACSCSNRP
ncbi:hypothetical protein BDV12DRAFT_200257 [Aspergillus spectabilis]